MLAFLQARLDAVGLRQVIGDKATFGKYDAGDPLHFLGRHADHPYQGGTSSLLVYLGAPASGGHTVFYEGPVGGDPEEVVVPAEGLAVIFDVYKPHEARAVEDGVKYIMGCELK